ncbi:hypothetical protein PUN28_010970 [Cardiocondyla obscurior]|uniref:Uncharacterized protein n=1 Tax=Cardiocondyla obscurior TaxID=286306 RepID=A0AAW2FKU1_9HYME
MTQPRLRDSQCWRKFARCLYCFQSISLERITRALSETQLKLSVFTRQRSRRVSAAYKSDNDKKKNRKKKKKEKTAGRISTLHDSLTCAWSVSYRALLSGVRSPLRKSSLCISKNEPLFFARAFMHLELHFGIHATFCRERTLDLPDANDPAS